LTDGVKVSRSTRHKIGHFGDVPQDNLLAWYGKTKSNTTKAHIHQSKEMYYKINHHNRFMALFLGLLGEPVPEEKLLDFMVQGKINRGRHTDHPAGRHSIQTNQCPPPSSPYFLQAGCPSCHQTNSVKALTATSTFVLGRRC